MSDDESADYYDDQDNLRKQARDARKEAASEWCEKNGRDEYGRKR